MESQAMKSASCEETMHSFIYKIYEACWEAYKCDTINFEMSSTILSNVMRTHEWSWRVIGITKNALEVYEKDEWKHKSGNSIQRAHLVDRKIMVKKVISADPIMSKEDLISYWTENDRTILATKLENSQILNVHFYEFDRSDLFRDKGTGFNFTVNGEGNYLKALSRSAPALIAINIRRASE